MGRAAATTTGAAAGQQEGDGEDAAEQRAAGQAEHTRLGSGEARQPGREAVRGQRQRDPHGQRRQQPGERDPGDRPDVPAVVGAVVGLVQPGLHLVGVPADQRFEDRDGQQQRQPERRGRTGRAGLPEQPHTDRLGRSDDQEGATTQQLGTGQPDRPPTPFSCPLPESA
jgi:hypothetical protein